jgi:hypothetical protein
MTSIHPELLPDQHELAWMLRSFLRRFMLARMSSTARLKVEFRRHVPLALAIAVPAVALVYGVVRVVSRVEKPNALMRGEAHAQLIFLSVATLLAFVAALLTIAAMRQSQEGWRRVAVLLTPIAIVAAGLFAYMEAKRQVEIFFVFAVVLPMVLIATHGGTFALRWTGSGTRRVGAWLHEGFSQSNPKSPK